MIVPITSYSREASVGERNKEGERGIDNPLVLSLNLGFATSSTRG